MPRSGERTRQLILDAAEELFSSRGIASVSLREINVAAGQRNKTALHYHFKDRDGLLQAISERHMPALQARQAEIHAELEEAGRLDEPTAFADVCIRPFAEYLAAGPSARAWLVIASELAAHPRTDVEAVSTHAAPATVDVGSRLYNRLVVDADPAVVVNRIRTISEAALHVVADRARLEADPKRTRDALPLADVADDLVQTMTAALGAPFPPGAGGSGRATAPPEAQERGQNGSFLAR